MEEKLTSIIIKLFIIGMGGFIGSVLRYLTNGLAQTLSMSVSFPFGTFIVNVFGCFLLGLLAYLSESRSVFSDSLRAFVFIGVLGGFTIFSAFSNETFNLIQDGETSLALINILAQIFFCLTAVWIGRSLTQWIWR